MGDETEIMNLLYQWSEHVDRGNGRGAAELMRHAYVKLSPEVEDVYGAEPVAKQYEDLVVLYEDGTPRTLHLMINPILEIAPDRKTAKCRSYYNVIQQLPGGQPEVIAGGRYHDQFEKVDGNWRFSRREFLMDFTGYRFEKVDGVWRFSR